jgi:peptidylamidoglycolate lyase
MMHRVVFFAVCLLSTIPAFADDVLGQGEFRYRVVSGWGREALAQVSVKNGHAVIIDGQGRLLFLTDDAKNNVIILDAKTGALIKQWTARLPGAHGMSLVKESGREVLFITDTQLHEVRKLTLDGEELAVFPWPEKAKLHADAKEYRPSKTIHFPNGEFAVFDGYGKDYIFHYKADGTLIRAWGGNIGEARDQLKHWGPHGGAFDDRDGTPRVVIGMSDQQEIRRFTPEGRFIDQRPFPGGNPRDIVLFGKHTIIPHLGDNWPKDKNAPGFISIVDSSWKIVSNIGAPPAVYENGVPQPMKSDGKTFIHPHGVAVDAEGNLYVAQFASPAAPLLKLERLK